MKKYIFKLKTDIFSSVFIYIVLLITLTNHSYSQYSTLYTMNGGAGDGYIPFGKLDYDGTYLYGTNTNDFGGGFGTVFKIKPDGTGFVKIHQFTGGAGGTQPNGLLLIGSSLYGVANGGANNKGILYKINTDGTGFTIILDFDGTNNGRAPNSRLIYYNSALYGTTQQGGTGDLGTIFKINTDGTGYQKLADHVAGNYYTDMIEVNGVFYGSFGFGSIGGGNAGTIFKINPDGTGFTEFIDLSTIPTLGSFPFRLINIGSTLYILTRSGSTNNKGCLFKVNTDGTGNTKVMDFGVSNFQILNLTLFGSVFIATATTTYGQLYNNQEFFYWMNPDGTNMNLLYDVNPGGVTAAPAEPSQGSPIIINGAMYGVAHHGGDIAGEIYKFIIPTTPIETTSPATNISYSYAVITGTVTNTGNANVTERGLVWSTTPNPTINSYTGIYTNGTGLGSISTSISGLYSNTIYHVRTYATNFVGTSYGSEISFTTTASPEDFAPNNGDGNGDGIPDSRQTYVHSIINPKTQKFITVVSLEGFDIQNVSLVDIINDGTYYYPGALVKFTVAASTANIKIIYHGIESLTGYEYRKKNSQNTYFKFNSAVFGTELIGGNRVSTVNLALTDGGLEDYDGIVNGSITDPGGPVILSTNANIPTLSEWARYLVLLSFFIFGTYRIKKHYT